MSLNRIEFAPAAVSQFGSLPVKIQRRVSTKIAALASDPRPEGCRKLKGAENVYRVHVGNYRVLYQIRDDILLILVVSVRKRGRVYKR